MYAVATSLAILLMSNSREAAEHLQEMLVGNILFVSWPEVTRLLALYGLLGLIHYGSRHRFLTVSFSPAQAYSEGWNVRCWDFLFFVLFGVMVTASVRLAGVLLVFTFLIIPAAAGLILAEEFASRLMVAWIFGLVASFLGILASVGWDLPTGAALVCTFGFSLILCPFLARLWYLRPRKNSPFPEENHG